MSAPAAPSALHLPGVEQDLKPGTYRALIEGARARGDEYSKIWDLFAFQHDVTINLGRFTQGVLRAPSTISPGLRELIAAYTSSLNECRFCTEAHAQAAGELLGDHGLVRQVLRDPDGSALEPRDKVLLRFVRQVTLDLPSVGRADVQRLQDAGWDDEALYFAITTCALFNFYNRWITATGVPEMSAEAHRRQGRSFAERGYVRD